MINKMVSENAESERTPTTMNHTLHSNANESHIVEETMNSMIDSIELHLQSKEQFKLK